MCVCVCVCVNKKHIYQWQLYCMSNLIKTRATQTVTYPLA